MGKIVWVLVLVSGILSASESLQSPQGLEAACLHCHQSQQIPDKLIYRRYLMHYSTEKRMAEAIVKYLKDPHKSASIMPSPFFLKFPMKEKMHLDDQRLRQYVSAYLEKFDLKKRLVLEK